MSGTAAYPAGRAATRGQEGRGILDRILGIFADVQNGEGVTAILLMLNIFLLLASYYLLKTIREPLILTQKGGAEVKSYAAAAIAGVLIVLVPVYSALASRVSRVKLINGVTMFFIGCLVAFFLADKAGYAVGTAFFIWVGIFNMMVIAQLWAFANDVYTVEQGKRLFAIVGFGASLGAIAGSFVTGHLVERFGPYPFMLAAAGLLGLCMILTNIVNLRERKRARERPETPPEASQTPGARAAEAKAPAASSEDKGIKGKSGFSLVLSNKYLLLIACLMVLANLVNTTGEYILSKTVVGAMAHGAAAVDEKKIIGAFYGNYFTIVNIVSALIQAFVVSRVIKWFGVRTALMVLPFVALVGYASMAFVPVLAFIRTAKIAENSLDYSLQNTTRNALYLPTSREAKYKAKQANDTFFVRLGDVLSAGLVLAGTTWLAFGPRQFALVSLVLILVWLVIAFTLGKKFQSLAQSN
ncbi:MAG TPA: Npt1/Npt2 family nucleotide transporter [Candidatus Limnocylindrales bacterium]|nr:Npt1/Npt2 family nucleotide transporter [Candidatus Limnocylindrales bacterium]